VFGGDARVEPSLCQQWPHANKQGGNRMCMDKKLNRKASGESGAVLTGRVC